MIRKLFKKSIFLDAAAGHDNPSALYDEGREAKKKLEEARTIIARLLHVQSRDIIFTSGGTESDNLAILGSDAEHIIISDVEHPAIIESAKEAERRGKSLSIIEAEDGGVVDIEKVKALLKPGSLVSIMLVNNETGAINPISAIARLAKAAGAFVHTDASQAAMTMSLDVSKLGVDMMTLDAAKVGGPKGCGLLVVRPEITLRPLMFGGGQERGLRPGTENVEAITAFAKALTKAQASKERKFERLVQIKKLFLEELRAIPQIIINSPDESVPSIVSVTIPGVLHEFVAIKLALHGVYISTGSSCKSGKRADENEALRFSFGKETSTKDVRKAVRILKEIMI